MFRRGQDWQDWFTGEWLARQLSWSAEVAILVCNIMQLRLLLAQRDS